MRHEADILLYGPMWEQTGILHHVTLPPECRYRPTYYIIPARSVELEGGVVYEVLNMIDDHSRLCVASRAMKVLKATDVVRVLHKAAETWGYPSSFLSARQIWLGFTPSQI